MSDTCNACGHAEWQHSGGDMCWPFPGFCKCHRFTPQPPKPATLEFDHWHTGPHIDPTAAVTEALSFVPDGWAATGNDVGKWESDVVTYGYGSSATKTTTWRVCVTVRASEGEA